MNRLQSLKAWTEAGQLAREAYRLTMVDPLKYHFGLADQIRRAGVSVPANIAEGYGLGTRPQLIRCLRIALGSAYELRTCIEIAIDLSLAAPERGRAASDRCTLVVRLLIGLLKRLRADVPRRSS